MAEVLRRRKWWVILSILFITLLALILTGRQEKQYSATASLLFRDTSSQVLNSSGVVDPTRQGATNASLVALPAVAARAAKIGGGGLTTSEVSAAVKLSPTNESDVVEIEATSPDPKRAALIANSYARGYIALRSELDQEQLRQAAANLSDRIAGLSPTESRSALGQSLRSQLDQLTLAESLASSSAQLVERATVPSSPSSPSVKRNLILAIMLGAIVGIGLAFLRDRFDQSLRTPDELEAVYHVPLLASVSRARARPGERAPALTVADLEAFRTLRANLRYFGVSSELRSILVSSPMAGDGKSMVALNLARTMAEMGDSVVLVEGDLHRPSGAIREGRKPKPGLSSVLTGEPLAKSLVDVPVTGPAGGKATRRLTVLPPGPLPPNPSELLESERMTETLEELEGQFDQVIIDSPALMVVSDMRALVGRVSGVLIVSAVNYTRRSAAQDFNRQVELLGGRPLGFVANLVPASRYGGDEYYGTT